MINQTPEILTCLGALFTMEYYKEQWHMEEVSDAEYDKAVTTLTEASEETWNMLNRVIEEEPDPYFSGHTVPYREYCKGIKMLREIP